MSAFRQGFSDVQKLKNYTGSSKESEGDRDTYITEELNLKNLLS